MDAMGGRENMRSNERDLVRGTEGEVRGNSIPARDRGMKMRLSIGSISLVAVAFGVGCGGGTHVLGNTDAGGTVIDSGQINPPDAGGVDAPVVDSGTDAHVVPTDSGPGVDAPVTVDSGLDAPVVQVDAGQDSGTDSGTPIVDSGTETGADAGCTGSGPTCIANVPQVCVSGSWVAQTPCSGATPICSAGACGGYLVTGGIRTTAPKPMVDAAVYLVSGGFEIGTRTCTDAGTCVTGGIVP